MSENLVKQESYFTKREWIMRYASPIKSLSFMAGPMIVIMIVNALYGIIDKQLTLNFAVSQVTEAIHNGSIMSPNIIPNSLSHWVGGLPTGYNGLSETDFAKQVINVSTQYSNTIVTILIALAVFTSIGTSIRFGQAMGARDKDRMNNVVISGFIQTSILIIFSTVILYFVYPFLITSQAGINYGERSNKYQFLLADEYSKMFVLGFGLLAMANFFTTLLRTEGKVGLVILINIFAVILNIAFGILFMDKLGMGMAGAVYGSMVAWSTAIVISVSIIIFSKNSLIKPNLRRFVWSTHDALRIWVVGLSPMLTNIIMAVVSFTSTILITHIHKTPGDVLDAKNLDNFIYIFTDKSQFSDLTSVHPSEQISSTLRINSSTFPWMALIYAPIFGASQGANVNYAYSYGAQKKEKMLKIFKLHLLISITWFLFALLLIVSFSKQMMVAFAGPAERSTWFIAYLAPMPFAGLTFTVISFYQGIGAVKSALFVSISRAFVFQLIFIVMGYFIAKGLSTDGSNDWSFFMMNGLLEIPSCMVALFFINRTYKLNKLRRNIYDTPDLFETPSYTDAIRNEFEIDRMKTEKYFSSKYHLKLERNRNNEVEFKKIQDELQNKIDKYNLASNLKEKNKLEKVSLKISLRDIKNARKKDIKNFKIGIYEKECFEKQSILNFKKSYLDILKKYNDVNLLIEKENTLNEKYNELIKSFENHYEICFEYFKNNKESILAKAEKYNLKLKLKEENKIKKIENEKLRHEKILLKLSDPKKVEKKIAIEKKQKEIHDIEKRKHDIRTKRTDEILQKREEKYQAKYENKIKRSI